MRGVSDDTDEGMAVIGAPTYADALGVIEEAVAITETDSAIGGTAVLLKKVSIGPHHVYLCEYSQTAADNVAPTSASSSTTFNLTSIEAISGGFIYIVSGASKGQLQYIVADTTNALTTKTAFDPVADTDAYVLKVLPRHTKLLDLNTAALKIKSAAAAGSGKLLVLENYIEADNIPFQRLDPTKHSGLTGLDTQHVKFWAELTIRSHMLLVSA